MFLFLRLLLAHFIGDFPLQFDSIFKMKQKGWTGCIPHVLIIVACCIALSWPYLGNPLMWAFIAFIGVTHLIQDSMKLKYSTPKHSFWTYLMDQGFHVAAMAFIFLTDLKNLQPPNETNFFIRLYCNDMLVVYLIALIFATYNGFFLIRTFKLSFLNKADRSNSFEKWYGMAERALIVSFFLITGPLFCLLPVILLLRPLIFLLLIRQLRLHKDFISLRDVTLSWTIAILGGLGLSLFQACYFIY
jgi:hypothetical protein